MLFARCQSVHPLSISFADISPPSSYRVVERAEARWSTLIDWYLSKLIFSLIRWSSPEDLFTFNIRSRNDERTSIALALWRTNIEYRSQLSFSFDFFFSAFVRSFVPQISTFALTYSGGWRKGVVCPSLVDSLGIVNSSSEVENEEEESIEWRVTRQTAKSYLPLSSADFSWSWSSLSVRWVKSVESIQCWIWSDESNVNFSFQQS